MLEKFAMRFSKALSTAPALHQAACTNTAPAAVPEGRTGPLRSACEKSIARGKTAMRSYWHTYHPQIGGKVSVEISTYSETGENENARKFLYVCVEGGGI